MTAERPWGKPRPKRSRSKVRQERRANRSQGRRAPRTSLEPHSTEASRGRRSKPQAALPSQDKHRGQGLSLDLSPGEQFGCASQRQPWRSPVTCTRQPTSATQGWARRRGRRVGSCPPTILGLRRSILSTGTKPRVLARPTGIRASIHFRRSEPRTTSLRSCGRPDRSSHLAFCLR